MLESLKIFIGKDKCVELIGYIKNNTPEDIIKTIMTKLTTEFDLLLSRFYAISEFGYRKIGIADISKLEQQINNMEFPTGLFEMFGGEKIDNVFAIVNRKHSSKMKQNITNLGLRNHYKLHNDLVYEIFKKV